MEHQVGMFAMVEGAAMEAFLNDKKVPGKDLFEKVDNYCKIYNVPAEIQKRMHDIRINRNIVAHGLSKDMTKLDYVSQEMKEYQSYYYRSKGKAGKSKAYNVDLAKGKAERVHKKPKAQADNSKPPRSDGPKGEKVPRDDSAKPKKTAPPASPSPKSSSKTPEKSVSAPKGSNDNNPAPKKAPGKAPASTATPSAPEKSSPTKLSSPSPSTSSSQTERKAKPTQAPAAGASKSPAPSSAKKPSQSKSDGVPKKGK